MDNDNPALEIYCFTGEELGVSLYSNDSAINDLIFPPNSLELGLYWMNLNVSMDKEISIETNDSTYIQISESMLYKVYEKKVLI